MITWIVISCIFHWTYIWIYFSAVISWQLMQEFIQIIIFPFLPNGFCSYKWVGGGGWLEGIGGKVNLMDSSVASSSLFWRLAGKLALTSTCDAFPSCEQFLFGSSDYWPIIQNISAFDSEHCFLIFLFI